MLPEEIKNHEIQRLKKPITFKNLKAYDADGEIVNCYETLSEVKFILEPKMGILTEDEILNLAPDSKVASEIKLSKGQGDFSDILKVHDSLLSILGLYYVTLLSLAIPILYVGNIIFSFLLVIIAVIPLFYIRRISNPDNYYFEEEEIKTPPKPEFKQKEFEGLPSLKKFCSEADNLKILYDSKEEVARELIEKRFTPPQLTYDKFMQTVESCNKLFYSQLSSVENIVNLAVEDTPRIRGEIDIKLKSMQILIDQLEDLINELVINMNSDDKSDDEIKVIAEMENLINSVKEY